MEQGNFEPKKIRWYNHWWGIIFLLFLTGIFLFLAVFIYNFVYYLGDASQQNINGNAANNQIQIATADDPAMGAVKPLITIVEFGDFQCPFCKEEYPIIRQVVNQYPNEVKLIFRDFPITASHPNALAAAVAADCVNEQGKFWQYHDLLYDNQDNLFQDNLNTLAQSLNINMDKFQECVSSQKYLNEVQNDLMDGMRLGVTGTPTFFIDGIKIPGVVSYVDWVNLIEKYKSLNKGK